MESIRVRYHRQFFIVLMITILLFAELGYSNLMYLLLLRMLMLHNELVVQIDTTILVVWLLQNGLKTALSLMTHLLLLLQVVLLITLKSLIWLSVSDRRFARFRTWGSFDCATGYLGKVIIWLGTVLLALDMIMGRWYDHVVDYLVLMLHFVF